MQSPLAPRRTPSALSVSTTSPASHTRRDSNLSSTSRRSSRTFNQDEASANGTPLSARDFGSSPLRGPGAHDSLADELAGAFDEDFGDEDVEEADSSQFDGSVRYDPTKIRDSGVDVSTPAATPSPTHRRHPSKPNNVKRHSRTLSRQEPPLDAATTSPPPTDLPRTLLQTIRDLENLIAQSRSTPSTILEESTDVPGDAASTSPIPRLIATLQSLGSQQSNLETCATRLITAHHSLTAHLAHQTRSLSSTTYFFLSPLPSQPLLAADEIDILLPAINDTISSLPQPTVEAVSSMDRLAASSRDAISALAALSDTIHMTRQTAATAARRLRVSKDMVADLRREFRLADDARAHIERASWDERLSQRRCDAECRDIVQGFDSVCESWRERLLGSGGIVA